RLELVWPTHHLLVAGVIPLGKGGNIIGGLTQARPDETVGFLDVMRNCLCLAHRRLVWRGGHQYALGGTVIVPTVIRTDHAVTLDKTVGQPCAPVYAQILPYISLPGRIAPGDQIAPEQGCRYQLAGHHLFGGGYHMPVIEQGILEGTIQLIACFSAVHQRLTFSEVEDTSTRISSGSMTRGSHGQRSDVSIRKAISMPAA